MSERIDLVETHAAGGQVGYGSEFEYDSEAEKKRSRRRDLAVPVSTSKSQLPSKQQVVAEYNKDEGIRHRYHILSLDAYGRHKKFINDYLQYFGGSAEDFKRDTSRDKRDIDVIKENHRFLWEESDNPDESWEKRLAKKYYDKLFKEYCITDLSRYKENKIALRWRVEKEVVDGKGQFVCGSRKCEEKEGLRSWEVNFGYMEHGIKRNALVKLRLCPQCSHKLNYHHKKKEVVKKRKRSPEGEPESHKKHRHAPADTDTPHRTPSDEEQKSSDTSSKTADSSQTDKKVADDDNENPWSGPAPVVEDKSRADEFEDYFEDMFL